MARFLELNLPSYNSEECVIDLPKSENLCICCLAQDDIMINLSNCSHRAFLQNYFKVDESVFVVCISCHTLLQKIELFRKQIEENVFSEHQTLTPTRKIQNLQYSNITITSNLDESFTSNSEENLKKEELAKDESDNNDNFPIEITTDIKIEHESSDLENDIPLAQIKKKEVSRKTDARKKIMEEKYEGKIKIVTLKRQELMEERENDAKKESYLKLPFKCEGCIKGFDLEITFKTHMEKHHGQKKNGYPCDICKTILGSKGSYSEHEKRHYKRYECMACGKRTHDIYSVSHHYNQQHGGDGIAMTFSCDTCHFTTDSYRAYRYHREKHKHKQQCTICGSTFVWSTGLRKHMNTVHNKTPSVYKCTLCDKTYKCKSGLHNHTVSAHRPNTAYCGRCQTHFATETNLKHHLKTHSAHVTNEDNKYVCNECDAKFLSKFALRTHIDWEHLKKIKYECIKCSKAFKTKISLNKHNRYVHEKKRPPRDKICDYCGKAFTTTAILLSHIRTHTGERPLRCAHCAATFAHSGALYTHKRLLHH